MKKSNNNNVLLGLVFIGLAVLYILRTIGVFPFFDFWDLAKFAIGLVLISTGVKERKYFSTFLGIGFIFTSVLDRFYWISWLDNFGFFSVLIVFGLLGLGLDNIFGNKLSFKYQEPKYGPNVYNKEQKTEKKNQDAAGEATFMYKEHVQEAEVVEAEIVDADEDEKEDNVNEEKNIEELPSFDAQQFDDMTVKELKEYALENEIHLGQATLKLEIKDAIVKEAQKRFENDQQEAFVTAEDIDEITEEQVVKEETFEKADNHQEESAQNNNTQQKTKYADYNYEPHDNVLFVEATFNNINKYVHAKDFEGGELRSTFGNLEIDLTESHLSADGAKLIVDCTFAKVTIVVPRSWAVNTRIKETLGNVNDDRKYYQDNSEPHLEIMGQVTLGQIEVVYF